MTYSALSCVAASYQVVGQHVVSIQSASLSIRIVEQWQMAGCSHARTKIVG